MINIIACQTEDRVIGLEGKLPWKIPDDLRRFRELTIGNICVMGRKTYQSIGRPLPDRTTIVISKSMQEIPGARVVGSVDEALAIQGEIFVCGGGQIYDQTVHLADKIYLTTIRYPFSGDTYFPELNLDDWNQKAFKMNLHQDHDPPFSYWFTDLERTSR